MHLLDQKGGNLMPWKRIERRQSTTFLKRMKRRIKWKHSDLPASSCVKAEQWQGDSVTKRELSYLSFILCDIHFRLCHLSFILSDLLFILCDLSFILCDHAKINLLYAITVKIMSMYNSQCIRNGHQHHYHKDLQADTCTYSEIFTNSGVPL